MKAMVEEKIAKERHEKGEEADKEEEHFVSWCVCVCGRMCVRVGVYVLCVDVDVHMVRMASHIRQGDKTSLPNRMIPGHLSRAHNEHNDFRFWLNSEICTVAGGLLRTLRRRMIKKTCPSATALWRRPTWRLSCRTPRR